MYDRIEATLRFTDQRGVEMVKTVKSQSKEEIKQEISNQIDRKLGQLFEF